MKTFIFELTSQSINGTSTSEYQVKARNEKSAEKKMWERFGLSDEVNYSWKLKK